MTGPHRLVRPMTARRPDEADRAATAIELFFDLGFVVVIATAAAESAAISSGVAVWAVAVLVLLTPLVPGPVLATGLILAGYLAFKLVGGRAGEGREAPA